jgi:hypothetical protein
MDQQRSSYNTLIERSMCFEAATVVDPGAVEFRRRAASNFCGAAAVENLSSRRRILSASPP